MASPVRPRIVLLGPPASGKGTQAAMLSDHFTTPAVSTGALLRDEFGRGTELGKEADRYTREGKFFPDELALAVVRSWLDRHSGEGFIFDGFPRTLPQAELFDSLLQGRGTPLHVVISLRLPEDLILDRILNRVVCNGCGASYSSGSESVQAGGQCPQCGGMLEQRRDDHEGALSARLAEHNERTLPVVEYYQRAQLLEEVDATRSRKAIFQDLVALIERRAA